MPVIRHSVTSLSELVQTVLQIRSERPADNFLWYRGVNCHTYKMLPKLMRDGKDEDTVFERERRLLTRFRQRSLAYWKEGYPQNEWEHLFAMQHYGLPTRLLDWSENLLVATFFSLSGSNTHTHDGACIPSLWCIDPVSWNRAMPMLVEYGDAIRVLTTADDDLDAYRPETTKRRLKSPVAMFGAHNSDRIVAQRGTFIVWGAESKPLEEVADGLASANLWNITFTGDRDALFADLRTIGVSETMVFPELSYLAEELTRTEGWR